MSDICKPPKGTHDLIGNTARVHNHIINTARCIAERHGYEEWATPIFENTNIFSRNLGDTSDVVTKEMYSFTDKGNNSLTLRPEGTAAICRAFVTNGLTQALPQRVFYNGPMFRYERPQKGRFRQFHQIGAELLGATDALMDAETIAMAHAILKALGLGEAVTLEINTLGDLDSRQAWREALVAYFQSHAEALSEESRARLEANPLRILDSKSSQDRALLEEAPKFGAYLNEASQNFWDDLRRNLDLFGVGFVENPHIVRGLDYYSHTAFEFVTDRLGAQGTVLAGGRYEGLVAQMGGPATPAIGWAGGIERLALLMENKPQPPTSITVVNIGEEVLGYAVSLLNDIRTNFTAILDTRSSVKKRIERAVKANIRYLVIIGSNEVEQQTVLVRDLTIGVQETVSRENLVGYLKSLV